ncbi:MAG: hypothetical protein IPK62_10730 [Bacteroidetes bacterium]|nr:hypothetical protein [Bacteroidota bacterium]
MKQLLFSTLLLLTFILEASSKDGYQIKVKFNDVTDSTILLCHYYGKGSTVFKR